MCDEIYYLILKAGLCLDDKEPTSSFTIELDEKTREEVANHKQEIIIELQKRYEEELYIVGDGYLNNNDNLLFHSIGAMFEDNTIKIFTPTMSRYIKEPYKTVSDIRHVFIRMGAKIDPLSRNWMLVLNAANECQVQRILAQYDKKRDPYRMGMKRCIDCRRWCPPNEIHYNGSCCGQQHLRLW